MDSDRGIDEDTGTKDFQLSDQDRAELSRRYGSANNTSSVASAVAIAAVASSSSISSVRGSSNKSLASMMQSKSNSNFNPSFETSDYVPPSNNYNNNNNNNNNSSNSSNNNASTTNNLLNFDSSFRSSSEITNLQTLSTFANSNSNTAINPNSSSGTAPRSGRTTPLSMLASAESEMPSDSVVCSVSDVASIFGQMKSNSSTALISLASSKTSLPPSNNNNMHSDSNNNSNISNSTNDYLKNQLEVENSHLKISIKELLREKESEVAAIQEKHNIQVESLKKDLKIVSEKLMRVERMGTTSDGDKSHEIEILSSQLAATELDRDMFDKKSERLRIELDERKSELNRVKMEYSRLRVESDGNTEVFKDQIRALELRYNKAITDNQEKLFAKDNEILKLEEQNRVMRSELMDKSQSLNHLSEDYNNVERRCQQADLDNNNLRRKVASLEQFESELTQARRRNQVLESQLESQTAETSRLSSQCQQLQLQLQQYQLQQNSSSSNGISSNSGTYGTSSGYAPNSYLSRSTYSNFNPNTNSSLSTNTFSSNTSANVNSTPISDSGNIDPPSAAPVSLSSQFVPSSKSIKADEWKSLGYPSEFAFAKDKGLLDIKSNASAAIVQQQQQLQNFNSSQSQSEISNPKPRLSTGRKSLGASIGSSSSMAGIINQLNSSTSSSIIDIPSINAVASTRVSQSYKPADRTPFATEGSSSDIANDYDSLDRKLTFLINEKKTLLEESSRLFQKGTKTLKEKSRLTFIDGRVDEISKEISGTRKQLSTKPV